MILSPLVFPAENIMAGWKELPGTNVHLILCVCGKSFESSAPGRRNGVDVVDVELTAELRLEEAVQGPGNLAGLNSLKIIGFWGTTLNFLTL